MQYEDTDSSPEEEVEDFSRIPKPGQLIRASRTQREMSREELGEATRLTEAVVISVEADDYAALGQPVYARGYYRKCADVLGLNGEMLVDAYEKRSGTGSPIPVIQQRPSIRYREGAGPWKMVGMLVALGLLLAVGGWWLLQNPAILSGFQANAVPAPAEAAPTPAVTAPRSETQIMSRAKPAVVATQTARPTPAANSATPAPSPALAQRPEASPAAEQQNAESAPAVPPKLSLQIGSGQAWASISDSQGQQLLYKLLPPGTEREVSGDLPFKVSLGRADNVRMWLNGQALDFSSAIEADLRAEFRILANGQVEG